MPSADTMPAKFRTSYVSNEHNIDRQYLDPRSGWPYNQFGYDNLDRLTGVTYFDTKVDTFTMDDLGNRIGNQTQRDILHNYYMDPQTNDPKTNRYSTIDAAPITHDEAGNMTQDRQGYVYFYDYENRIARIYKLSGETQITVATFDYDALGHRVRTIDAVAGQTTLFYNKIPNSVPPGFILSQSRIRRPPDWNHLRRPLHTPPVRPQQAV
ncbi:MAG: hypothetical protein GX455_15375 [Phycisphaerae bacterium]|nr:hypothetical protein [Phycisphaerae bacterium]